MRLAGTTGLEELSINLLVENAGVSKGTFFHHFGDRTSYLVELHRELQDKLVAELLRAVEGLNPGRARLAAASETYLDACLRYRGVKALRLEARGSTVILEEAVSRNVAIAELLEVDFQAMGVEPTAPIGTLVDRHERRRPSSSSNTVAGTPGPAKP